MKQFISTLIGIFIISLLQAQPGGWQVNSADFEYSMTLTATVELDSVSYGAENDYLAAFIEGECRGVAQASWVETYGTYMFFLTVFSSEYSGKQIDFKHYSAQNASILSEFYPQYFSNRKNLGTASDPFLISDEAPEDKYQVIFRVYDGTDLLQGATISISNTVLTTDSEEEATKYTDGEGKASFELQGGEYGYTCSADGYESVSDTLTVASEDVVEELSMSLLTGIDVNGKQEKLVFPNPAYDRISISSDDRIESVKLINLNGQVMIQKEGNISELNVDHYNPGIYLLQLKTNNNEVHNVKLIIR